MAWRRDRSDSTAGHLPQAPAPAGATGPQPWSPGNAALGRMLRRAELTSQGAGPLDPKIEAAIDSARGGGAGLPDAVRVDMEDHFGVDLSTVRVHTGARADSLNRSVQARAFAVGSDIFFAGGSYDPAGAQGRELLAHELTHVVQQDVAAPAGGATVSHPADPAEMEARRVATAISRTPAGGDAGAGLGLMQRAAGNRAVARAFAPLSVHRFAGHEHEQLGDATGATVDLGGGIVLTWGQVVAIAGDEYGSIDELRQDLAAPGGPARLRGRLEHAGVKGPIPSTLPTEDAHSNARYVELAMYNAAHFAAGGSAIPTWRSYHENALLLAVLSGMDANGAQWQQAQLTEAFGQHFLTDAFSGGHVRTPRAEIMAWYQGTFAPRALGRFIAQARKRVSKALSDDLGRQMVTPNAVIRTQLDTLLAVILALFDGMIRDKFQDLFGVGISGAISGVLHDQDNERGVWVRSEAHPAPWVAYGDARLKPDSTTFQQAQLAVLAAREQLLAARTLGAVRNAARGVMPALPSQSGAAAVPGMVHFGFDSTVVNPVTSAALDQAANYLIAHSEYVVDLVGHTCPVGDDGYNMGLGMRRAEAVAAALMARGVPAMRIRTASGGKQQLLTADPTGYSADRRVELFYRLTGAPSPDLVWAQEVMGERWTPPYQAVERYVPQEATELNEAQEDWQWGSLTSTMADAVDTWVAHYVTSFKPSVLANPALDDIKFALPDLGLPVVPGAPPVVVRPVVLHPRPIVEQILDEIIKVPTQTIGNLVGQPAANRSTTPLPPRMQSVPQ